MRKCTVNDKPKISKKNMNKLNDEENEIYNK